MSAGSLRKRVELLEQIFKPQLKSANLATTPTSQPSDPIEELKLIMLRARFPDITAEENVELERLNALYPEDPNAPTSEEAFKIMEDEYHKENEERRRQSEARRRRR
jgi:hypothetical protein